MLTRSPLCTAASVATGVPLSSVGAPALAFTSVAPGRAASRTSSSACTGRATPSLRMKISHSSLCPSRHSRPTSVPFSRVTARVSGLTRTYVSTRRIRSLIPQRPSHPHTHSCVSAHITRKKEKEKEKENGKVDLEKSFICAVSVDCLFAFFFQHGK